MLYLPNSKLIPCYYCNSSGLAECDNCDGFDNRFLELDYLLDHLMQFMVD